MQAYLFLLPSLFSGFLSLSRPLCDSSSRRGSLPPRSVFSPSWSPKASGVCLRKVWERSLHTPEERSSPSHGYLPTCLSMCGAESELPQWLSSSVSPVTRSTCRQTTSSVSNLLPSETDLQPGLCLSKHVIFCSLIVQIFVLRSSAYLNENTNMVPHPENTPLQVKDHHSKPLTEENLR